MARMAVAADHRNDVVSGFREARHDVQFRPSVCREYPRRPQLGLAVRLHQRRLHTRPARLLVPHLYFWKSAGCGLRLTGADEPGFWSRTGTTGLERRPGLEQRYWGD